MPPMPPQMKNLGMNINTFITVAGFFLTILTGAMTFQNFKTSMEIWKTENDADVKALQSEVNSLKSEISTSKISAAVAAEKMNAIVSSLARIERKLDQPDEEEQPRP